MRALTRAAAVALLRQAEGIVEGRSRPVLELPLHRAALDLWPCAPSALPAVDVGQSVDCRLPTDGPEGLHVQLVGNRLRVHLDAVDATRRPLAHLVADTAMLPAALGGASAAVALTGSPTAAVVGAALGALLGARRADRPVQLIRLDCQEE